MKRREFLFGLSCIGLAIPISLARPKEEKVTLTISGMT